MNKSLRDLRSQAGDINALLIPLILVCLLFAGTAYFAYWAYMQRQDYKNNVDSKVAAAVDNAKKSEDIVKDQAFAQAEKNPLTTYESPSDFGSVQAQFPKTWSVYVQSNDSQPINVYFNPQVVPNVSNPDSSFALRIQELQADYSSIVKNLDSYVKNKQVTMQPFSFPKVPTVIGVRLDGHIVPGKQIVGSMVIIPLRDKTLEVWTENQQNEDDFNNIILPNFTFQP